jgi:hypothetical protein
MTIDLVVMGRQQCFNWMSVDPITGNIYIVFYDRRDHADLKTDVYMAVSADGGESFTNEKISQEPFEPNSDVYMGDYINITAYGGICEANLDGAEKWQIKHSGGHCGFELVSSQSQIAFRKTQSKERISTDRTTLQVLKIQWYRVRTAKFVWCCPQRWAYFDFSFFVRTIDRRIRYDKISKTRKDLQRFEANDLHLISSFDGILRLKNIEGLM